MAPGLFFCFKCDLAEGARFLMHFLKMLGTYEESQGGGAQFKTRSYQDFAYQELDVSLEIESLFSFHTTNSFCLIVHLNFAISFNVRY